MQRCISFTSGEFPEGQAVAICFRQWDERKYQLWKSFDDEAQRYERTYAPRIYRAMNKGVENIWKGYNGTPPTSAGYDFTPLYEVLREMFPTIGARFGVRTINQVKEGKFYPSAKAEPEYRNILVDEMLAYFNGEYTPIIAGIEGFSRDVIEMIGDRVFRQATEEGWSIERTAQALKRQFEIRNISRARTIARTEVLRAASVGDDKGIARIAQDTGTRVESEWLPTFDNVAREFHVSMAGEKIIRGQGLFKSGLGNEFEYPRAASAPAVETINCRCSLAHRLI